MDCTCLDFAVGASNVDHFRRLGIERATNLELRINDNSSRKQPFLLTTTILLDHIHLLEEAPTVTLSAIRRDGHTNGSPDDAGDPNADVQTRSGQTVGVSAFQPEQSRVVAPPSFAWPTEALEEEKNLWK